MSDRRSVTVVVCDGSGSPLGQLPEFEAETPWWQDVTPIVRRYPTVTILRLLSVTPGPLEDRGGAVAYLAEPAPGTDPPAGLAPTAPGLAAQLGDDRLRQPWARPGGPAGDLAWAMASAVAVGLAPAGSPAQQRTWNLSAIWTLAVRRRDGSVASLWLKCLPTFCRHEAGVLRLLERESVPRIVAASGHRLLLGEMPGHDGYEASTDEAACIIDELVALQLRTVPRLHEFVSAGVPDARAPALAADVCSLVARRGGADPSLRRPLAELAASALQRCVDAAACGLPDVVVHGDAHPGNARLGADPPMLFDWGDSRVGNPLLDLVVLERAPAQVREELTEHWLSAWERAVPGSEPRRGWKALRPVAMLRTGVVYQRFLDHIEPSEQVYHARDVPHALERAVLLAGDEGIG